MEKMYDSDIVELGKQLSPSPIIRESNEGDSDLANQLRSKRHGK
jgi:hypothetical protein